MKADLNQAMIEALGASEEAADALDRVAAAIVDDAQLAAPKRTGAGAASIHAESGVDERSVYRRISWDTAHYYMKFHELGTSRQSATPFLRPAALKRRSL